MGHPGPHGWPELFSFLSGANPGNAEKRRCFGSPKTLGSSPKPLSTPLLLSAYSAWDLGRLAVSQMRHHFNTDASWLILAPVPQGRVEMFAFEICREYLLMHFNKESSAQLGAVIGQPCLLQINKTGGYFCHLCQSGCC